MVLTFDYFGVLKNKLSLTERQLLKPTVEELYLTYLFLIFKYLLVRKQPIQSVIFFSTLMILCQNLPPLEFKLLHCSSNSQPTCSALSASFSMQTSWVGCLKHHLPVRKATNKRMSTRSRKAPHATMMAITATPRPSTFSGGGRAFMVNKVSRLKI